MQNDWYEFARRFYRENQAEYRPTRQGFPADLVAGLTFAVVNVPQAMATALLAAVNPVFGLYTLMIATPLGAIFTSSVFMNVSTTSALAVAAGSAIDHLQGEQRVQALIVLVMLVGIFQMLAGLLRLGFLLKFVSNSVMVGFITGIALLIIMGQVGDFTGYISPFQNKILKSLDTLLHFDEFNIPTFVVGLATVGLIYGFGRTKLRRVALILALIVATLLPLIFGWQQVLLVRDIADIPRALPKPVLPNLWMIVGMSGPALAIAIIGLVQGAGVSQSYPNPDGSYPNVSRDFFGQGVANFFAAFFQAIPAGGSMSGTAVIVSAGARTRWANIVSGVFVALIVLLLAPVVGLIPMPAMAGLLIVVGIQSIKVDAIVTVYQTNKVAATVMFMTTLTTLIIPLQFAVFVGVAFSILLHVARSSNRVRVVQFVPVEGGFPEERAAPDRLESNAITILHVYGSLFFAGASTFEKLLPTPAGSRRPVVILLMRGRDEIGSTFLGVLRRYADNVKAAGGKVILTGVDDQVRHQLARTGMLAYLGEENVLNATPRLGEAMNQAVAEARAWLEVDGK